MKFKDLFKFIKPAASIAASLMPGGAAVVEAVNAFLPDDKKLPATATGMEVATAFEKLPPESQVALGEKEIDLAIAKEEGWTKRYQAMTESDGQSTRPKIAYMLAKVLCFEIIAFTVWCFVYPDQMKSSVLWTVFGSLTTAPAGLLAKYFGELRKEQGQRVSALGGSIQPFGLLNKMFK